VDESILTPGTIPGGGNVSVCIFNQQKSRAACIKSEDPRHTNDQRWSFTGGELKCGESLAEGGMREIAEETKTADKNSKTGYKRIWIDPNYMTFLYKKSIGLGWGGEDRHHSFWLANRWMWVDWSDEEWNSILKHPLDDSDLISPLSWPRVHRIYKRREMFLKSHFPAFFKALDIDVTTDYKATELCAYG